MVIKNRSQDEIKKIIYDYLNNYTYNQLEKKYKISHRSLTKIFKENKININKKCKSKHKIIIDKNGKVIHLKYCKKCNSFKELDKFSKSGKSGLQAYCIECRKVISKEDYNKTKNNKDLYTKYLEIKKIKNNKKWHTNKEFHDKWCSYKRAYGKYGTAIKRCSSCGEYKSKNNYNKYTLSDDGLYYTCNDCLNQVNIENKRDKKY